MNLNFSELFGKIQEMQVEMTKVRERLDNLHVEAESGGGMVRVTATANRKILKIKIDPDIIDKDDPEIIEDLVAAAINRVMEKAEEASKEELGKVSSNYLPNIPGMDLGKFGM